jgi:hypothetical protein
MENATQTISQIFEAFAKKGCKIAAISFAKCVCLCLHVTRRMLNRLSLSLILGSFTKQWRAGPDLRLWGPRIRRPLSATTNSSFFFLLRIITYLFTYGAEPFLRSRQLCSYSRTSQNFMEPESSLSYSQEPSTGPYPEPDRSSPYHPILSL